MAFSRRIFIRILGGGAVTLTGAALIVPRLDAMPAEAIEGWRGPAANESDPRRRALAWALLAPNPHNLQSWAVDLSQPGAVLLFVDHTRLLPETDPQSRQIMIGHGCFLEILRMAAAADGWLAESTLFPQGEWTFNRPVARVTFRRLARLEPETLFAQVPLRRTVKGKFDARPLAGADAAALSAGFAGRGLSLSLADGPAEVDRLRRLAIAGSELEMSTHRTHKESIDVVRIGADEIAAHRDGISLKGPMIWALRQTGQFRREEAMTPGTPTWNGGRDYALAGYASARAFGWIDSADNSRATQVEVGRAFVRLQLTATARGVASQPHSQTLQEYPEMSELRAAMHRATSTDDGRTLQMFFRLGYAADPGPSPRRPLHSLIRA